MVTVLGGLTVAVLLVVWFMRREWTQYVIAVTVVLPQTAGLVVGGNGVPLFYLSICVLIVMSAPHLLAALARSGDRRVPCLPSRTLPDLLGLALVAWAAVIGFAGPRIFSGLPVFDPSIGVDLQVGNMSSLAPSLGNAAQFGYLALAVTFLLLSGRLFPVDRRLIGTAMGTLVVLAGIRMVAEPFWPHELLQNMPGFAYATPERLSGSFYEPSVLGLHLTAAAAYFVSRLVVGGATAGHSRIRAAGALVLIAVEFVANGSGTALIGLAIVAGLGLVVVAVRRWRRQRASGRRAAGRVHPVAPVVALLGIVAVITQAPVIWDLTIGAADRKTDSVSFAARSASNLRSAEIVADTFGLGVGLGSHRPSSLFFFVVSCLGIIGTALLIALIVVALRRVSARHDQQPVAWALLGMLVAAVVAVPDLSTPLLWAGLAACLAQIAGNRQARSSGARSVNTVSWRVSPVLASHAAQEPSVAAPADRGVRR